MNSNQLEEEVRKKLTKALKKNTKNKGEIPNEPLLELIMTMNINELEILERITSENYYNKIEIIPDQIYDLLVQRIRELNPKSKVLEGTGAQVPDEPGVKIRLIYMMPSISNKFKVSKESSLLSWKRKWPGPYLISDKEDGMSVQAVIIPNWNKNRITSITMCLVSKGKGVIGRNINYLIPYINFGPGINQNSLIQTFSHNTAIKRLVVRGELIIKESIYRQKYSHLKHSRGAVNGLLVSKDGLDIERAKDTDFVIFEIMEPDGMIASQQLEFAAYWGFNVVPYFLVNENELTFAYLDKLLEQRKANSLYGIDGLVIASNQVKSNNKDKLVPDWVTEADEYEIPNPDYMFAYKGIDNIVTTTVKLVQFVVQSTGVLFPRINFEEVNSEEDNRGSDLNWTSGYNARYIENNKISKGAVIRILFSGKVIPVVWDVLKPGPPPYLPDNRESVPIYNRWTWDNTHTSIKLIYPHLNPNVIIMTIVRFMKFIKAKEWAEATIRSIVSRYPEKLGILEILTIKGAEISSISGLGVVQANNLINSLYTALKTAPFISIAAGSNTFGKGFANRKLELILKSTQGILINFDINNDKSCEYWFSRVMELDGIENKTASAFINNLHKFQEFWNSFTKIMIDDLKINDSRSIREFNIYTYGNQETDNNYIDVNPNVKIIPELKGKTITFTGIMPKWVDIIEASGGKISDNVTKSGTDIVVYTRTDTNNYDKAFRWGKILMTPLEFERQFGLDAE